MTGNPHLATEVEWSGAPLDQARLVAILLHGRDQSPALARQLVAGLLAPDLAVVAPAAADGSWYPRSFLAARHDNQPRLDHALARVAALSRQLTRLGAPRAVQVVIGFSQGACLACEVAWTASPDTAFAGVIAFTGGLIGPPGTAWPPATAGAVAGLPLWISGGQDDPWVPAWRMRETTDAFAAAGARVQLALHPGADHGVRAAELAGAAALLAAIGAPRCEAARE